MNSISSLIAPEHGALAVRLLNLDSVEMIEKRVLEVMIEVHDWYTDPMMGGGADFLLREAPLFDTFLEDCLCSSAFEERGSRERAWFLFSMGLSMGSNFRSLGNGGLWEEPVLFLKVIRRLSQCSNDELPTADLAPSLVKEVARVSEQVAHLSTGVERIVFANFRLAMLNVGAPGQVSGALRVLFFLGLVGAGVLPPWEEASSTEEEKTDLCEPSLIDQEQGSELNHEG